MIVCFGQGWMEELAEEKGSFHIIFKTEKFSWSIACIAHIKVP